MFPWTASGRTIASDRDEGVTKLLFDYSPEAGSGDGHAGRGHGRFWAAAIEIGADTVDAAKTIHPHPTLGESIGMAAEVAHGSCTDVPPGKR